MKIQNKKSHQYKKILALLLTCLLVIVVITYGIVAKEKSLWPFEFSPSNTPLDGTSESVNYNPPTNEEIKEGQDAKQRLIDDKEKSEERSNNDYKQVNVGVTFSEVVDGKLEIRAFTPSVIEGDGVCTANLQKGNIKVTESSPAFIDSTTTQCQPIFIPIDKFSLKGVWSLVVSYKSSRSIGESSIIEINI